MKIHDDHMFHGAALIQIAESKRFTAINSLKVGKKSFRNAYRINDNISIYLKYCTKPKKGFDEYLFTFTEEHLVDLKSIAKVNKKCFIALVCVEVREICCLSYEELLSLVETRKKAKEEDEDQYQILVTAPSGKKFRVYVNSPGRRKISLEPEILIGRSDFPKKIFS